MTTPHEPPPSRRPVALWVVAVVTSVVVAAGLAVLVTRDDSGPDPQAGDPLDPRATTIDATAFLDTYVEPDGRVARLDQGGDTVSEGQAYGMLIALVADDRERFDAIWSWTQTNLARDDGLFSWQWRDGEIVDPSAASDAEVDIVRALVVAARTFDEPSYQTQAVAVGAALLEHLTVPVPEGRLLVAGEWATEAPYAFNPSYVSPVTTSLMSEITGDPRWEELERGSRAAVQAVSGDGRLPPNWAQADESGAVTAVASPDGTGVEYGYDAARTLLRHAESCDPADRRIAAEAAEVAARTTGDDVVAVYDLAGSPQTADTGPLTTVAQAAGFAAAGDTDRAGALVATAAEHQQAAPTYYGDAWAVLGPALLTDPTWGGCPPLEDLR